MKKSHKYLFMLAFALMGTLAFAIAESRVSIVNDPAPQGFVQGFYVGPLAGPNVIADVKNKTTRIIGASTTYQLGTIGTSVGFTTCAQTWAVTATGARTGDWCHVTTNIGADGGTALPTEALLSCDVTATNVVKGKMCYLVSDGGSFAVGDAGFSFHITSNQ